MKTCLYLSVLLSLFPFLLSAQGNALNFDGTNDFVEVGFSPLNGNANFTVEGWFVSSATNGGFGTCPSNFRRIFSFGGSRLEVGECGGDFSVFDATSTSASIRTTGLNIRGSWNYFALVKSGSTLTLYLNGTQVDTWTTSASFSVAAPFRIGRWPGAAAPGEDWQGSIDEFRVWNYARTINQITSEIMCELNGDELGLVAYYNFNQGIASGSNLGVTTLLDSSPSNNNGGLSSFALSGSTSNWVATGAGIMGPCSPPCIADFDFVVESCGTVNFTSSAPTGSLLFTWDFGDGQGASSPSNVATHTYNASATYTVCLTISDLNCTDTQCQNVFVSFNDSPPTIDCPNSLVLDADPGTCSSDFIPNPFFPNHSPCAQNLMDGCIRSDGLNFGDPFPVGVTTIICTSSDNFGSDECAYTITVVDNEFPQYLDCPTTITGSAVGDLCGAIININPPPATDNCGVVSNVCVRSDGLPLNSIFPVGTTIVTCTATDAAGNADVCEFSVVVTDAQAPLFLDCPIALVEAAQPNECEAILDLPTPTALDNCLIESVVCVRSDGLPLNAPFPLGTTFITCTATDVNGNTAECAFSVTIIDETPPQYLDCPTEVFGSINGDLCETNVDFSNPQAVDNCSLASNVCVRSDGLPLSAPYPLGTTIITCTATDADGNTAVCSFPVVITDNQGPLVNCPGDQVIFTSPGTCFGSADEVTYPSGFDNCGPVTIVCVRSDGQFEGAPFFPGTTTLSCTITDESGNTATCVFTVTVIDNEDPILDCPGDIIVNTEPGECFNASIDLFPLQAFDNCDEVTVICVRDDGQPLNAPFPLGTTCVECTASDNSQNFSSCTTCITVLDEERPEIICPPDICVGVDGENGGIVTFPNPMVTDNCDATFSCDFNSGDFFPFGETVVTCIAEDDFGNMAECSFTINVVPDSCVVDSLNISTGIDPENGNILNGGFDPLWTLVSAPSAVDIAVPRPASVTTGLGFGWTTLPGSNWISALPDFLLGVPNNCDDVNNTACTAECEPYVFERCFCKCGADSVRFVFNTLHDDVEQIFLVNQTTNVATQLYSDCVVSTSNFINPSSVDVTLFLEPGKYCIETHIYTIGVSMGFNIDGYIAGAGLEADQCCVTTGSIVGRKFHDEDCDGEYSVGEPYLEDWEINLTDGLGNIIATTTTDPYGFYAFVDLLPGTYTVSETLQPGWTPSSPIGGQQIVVVENATAIEVNFANCFGVDCVASFTASLISPCGDGFIFNPTPNDPSFTYAWDFGDGSPIDNAITPFHTYGGSGCYDVTLTVTDLNDCVATYTEQVCPNLAVEVYFDALTNCLDVGFTNIDLGGAAFLNWNFGDGNTSSSPNPTHTYSAPGTYQICLSGSSIDCSDVHCVDVTVEACDSCCVDYEAFCDRVEAGFQYTEGINGCRSIFLTPNALDSCDVYSIDWGDGNSIGPISQVGTQAHEYTMNGVYTVCMFVNEENASGEICWEPKVYCEEIVIDCDCEGELITQVNPTGIGDCYSLDLIIPSSPPTITFYQIEILTPGVSFTLGSVFSFGGFNANVTSSTTIDVTHSGLFFPLGNSIGALEFCLDNVPPGTPVDLHFQWFSPNLIDIPALYCEEFERVTPDPCDGVMANIVTDCLDAFFVATTISGGSYLWNFGDGNTSTQMNPAHTYASPGTYTVTLTVTEPLTNCEVSTTLMVVVEDCSNCSVAADFSFTQTGNKLFFTDLSTSPNTIISWFWDFDDGGNTSTSQNPCYIYPTAGTYNVCLNVQAQDSLGNSCEDMICMPVTFAPCDLMPDFNFSKLNNQLQFTNLTTPVGVPITWNWTADGNSFSTIVNPIYAATPPGPVTICLEATLALPNGQLCTEEVCKVIQLPEIMGDTTNCGSDQSLYMITTMPGYQYNWSITGGHTLTTIGPDKVLVNWVSAIDSLLCDTLCVVATNGVGDTCKVSKVLKLAPDMELEILYDEICFMDTLGFQVPPDVCPGAIEQPSDCIKACENTKTVYSTHPDPGCNYEWKVVGGTIIGAATLDSVCVMWDSISPARLKLIKTNSFGCQDSTELCVELLPPPEAMISANDVCLGQTTQFSMDYIDADEWIWYFGDGSSSTLLNPTHTYATPGTHQVCLVIKKKHYSKSFGLDGIELLICNECVCVDTVKLDVVVDPLAGPDIECVATVCAGDTVCYNTNVICPGPYLWNVTGQNQIINGGGTSDDFICIVWGDGPLGTIELEVQNCTPALCNKPTKVDIPILSNEFEIEGPIEVCNNESYVYDVIKYGGAIYDWEVIGGTIISDQFNTVVINWNAPGPLPYTGQVIVTVDSYWLNPDGIPGGDCWGQDTLDVMILPNMAISGPDKVCLNDQETYNISPPGINVNWQIVGGTAQTPVTNTNTVDILWDQGPGIYTIQATAVDPTQVCEDVVYLVVEVIELPPPTDIAGQEDVCPGDTFDYVASGLAAGSQFVWNVIGGTLNYTSYNSANITWGAVPPYEIWVKNQRLSPPICESDSINLVVNQVDVSSLAISGEVMPCVNTTNTYTALPLFNNIDYNWTIVPATAGQIQSGQGTNQVDITWSAIPGNATIELDICGQTISYPVQVINFGPFTLAGSYSCNSTGSTLTVTPAIPGASYEWNNPSGLIGTTTTNTFNISSPGCYTVFIILPNGCEGSANLCLDDFDQVEVKISSPMPDFICTATYAGGAVPDFQIDATQNSYIVSSSYTWTCLRNNSPLTTGTGPSFSHTSDLPTGNFEYYVEVQTVDGCTLRSNSLFITHNDADGCYQPGSGSTGGSGGGPGGPNCIPNPTSTAIIDNIFTPYCNIINFSTALSALGNSHTWDFGDGTPLSTQKAPTHTYTNIGWYNIEVRVNVSNTHPSTDSCLIDAITSILVPVVADFSADLACEGDPVQFTDLSSAYTSNTIVNWEWDFDGDSNPDISGGTPAEANPTYTFATGGWKTVELVVTTQDGCKAIQTKTIEVLSPPAVNFSAATQVCLGEGVDFTDLSSGTVVSSWSWDFGEAGATSVDQNPYFVYASAGTKTVTLTVTDIYGCMASTSQTIVVFAPQVTSCDISPNNPGPLCQSDLPFTLTAPNSPSGQYLWSNGATTPTISVTTPGDYSVTIYDTNGCECVSPPVEIKVSDPPPVVINGPAEICQGEVAQLDATLPGGNYTYQWTTPSGPAFNTSGVQFAFQAGTYTVVITDQNTGCSNSGSHTIQINPNPPAPTIVASPNNLCAGMPITLTVNPVMPNSTYQWSTGQAGTSVTVSLAGTYTVQITDDKGCSSESSITINPSPEKCIVPSGCYEVCRNDTMCIPGIYDQYEWMRDGAPITSLNDTCIVFDQSGVYTVKMTNSFGCMTTSDDLIITVIDCDSMMVLCDSVMVDYVETADTSDYCCFDIILTNQVPDFFTMVKITPLTALDLTNVNILDPVQWSTGGVSPTQIELLSNTGALCPGTFDRYIPTGTFTPISFCLDNFGPIPQQVLVEWIGCDGTICPDTLDFDCARCIDITNDTLVCDNGQLKFNFEFTNVWDLDICSLAVNYVLPTGAIIDPDPLIFNSCIPVGGSSGPQSLCIDNVGNASEIKLVLQAFEDECCWCLSDTLCLPVPVCCDTCESIQYVVSDTTIHNDTCCFTLDVYHCVEDFFTGIKLEALGNVFFSEQQAPNDWFIQSPANKMGTWHPKPTPPHGTFIPPGWNYDKIQFCLGGYDTPADVPQKVKFSWLAGSDNEVVCMDTLEFNCQPPPIEDCAALVDTTIQCLPNGDYQIDLKAMILANFTVQQLWVRDLHSKPPGASFTPGAPVIVNGPFNSGSMVNIPPITVGNVSPGDSVCFYITLFDNLVGDDGSNHCCHTDTICVVIPEDLCPPDACVCTGWNDFTVSDHPLNTWSVSGVMCGDHVVLPDCAFEFWLDGSFNCEGDSCMPTHNWALVKQGGGPVDPLSNFGTGNQFSHGWDVTPNGDPNVSGPGIYELILNGVCSDSSTCSCMLTFEIPCDSQPMACDTLDWSQLNYSFSWVYNDSCQTPDLEINFFPNGGLTPDWTEFDFDCDSSPELTVPAGGYPVSWNFGTPGTYQICIKAYEVVAGDTCFDERVISLYVPECENECEVPCWDNFVWEDLGQGQFFFIIDVVAYNGDIIFGVRNNGPNNSVFRWDGSTITQMGDGLNDDVMALEVHGGRLYAGGSFTATIPGTPLNNIAVYNDALDVWEDVGNGVSDRVRALQSTPTGLAVGGHFQLAGLSSLVVDNVAIWDGVNWNALGTGTNGKVTGLGMYNGNLVVGGEFSNVGNNIAVWDFSSLSWTTVVLGSGVDGVGSNFYDGVWAMEQLGADLYIGGTFGNANNGGTACTPAIVPGTQNVAKWNAASGCWETLAGGVSGSFTAVYDLKIIGGNVIAAGTYNTIGGQSINSIARWDGTQWNDLGLPSQFLLHAVSCLPDSSGKCELYTGGEGPLRKLSMSCDTCELALMMPSDTSICVNDLLTLNPIVTGNTGPFSCSWTPSTNLSSATSCNPVFSTSVPGTYTYSLTVADSLGCDTTAMITITVDPCDTCMLSLTMPSDTTICANDQLTLNPIVTGNTGPFSCSWTPSTNLSSATSCNPVFSTSVPGTYTYSLTVADSLGCDTTAMITITVDPCDTCMLSLTMPSDTTICANDQLTLNPIVTGNTGPFSCSWTPSTNLSSATSCNPVFSTSVPGTYTYSLTVADSLGCDTTAMITITVDPCDTCMLSLTMPSDTTICANDQLTLNPIVTGNTGPFSCSWTPSTNLSSATSCNPVFSTSVPGTYTYSLTVADSLGCDTTAMITITVDPCDTCMLSLTMPSDTTICANDQLTLNPIVTGNTGPFSCSWTPSTNLSSATSCNPVFSTSVPGTYTYSLTVADSLGCDTTAMITITVDPCDTCMLSLTMPSDTTICANDQLTLNSIVTGNTGPFSCSWTPSTNLSSATSCNPVFSTSVPGTYTYSLTVADSLGCDRTAMITITVDPCDTCMLSLTMPSDTTICANDQLTLNPIVTGNTGPFSCSWTPSTNLSSATSCNPVFSTSVPGTYTYSLTVADSLGCDTTAMITITVDPCDTCMLSLTMPSDTTICANEILVLNPTVTGNTGPYTCNWSPSANLSSASSCNPIFATTVPGIYNYTFTITDSLGCDTSGMVTIIVDDCPAPCQTCDSIQYVITPITIQEDTCCFNLDIYHCSDSLFTGINLEALGNIFFSEQVAPPDWYITTQTSDQGTWHPKPTPPHGTYIPPGWNVSKIQFCLGGYDTFDDIPQEIQINWLGGSNNNVVCTDTLEFFCQPPAPEDCAAIVDTSITCLADGTYLLDLDLEVLANFTVDQIKVRNLHSEPAGAIFNPSNPIISGPFNAGDIASMTPILITNAQPGDSICFYLTLFNNIVGQDASNHFCHTDTICIVLPPCEPISDCAYLDWSTIKYSCEYEYRDDCITPELTIDFMATGNFVPDWVDIDLDCDSIYDIEGGSLPFTYAFDGPGIYDICIRSCEVIDGDTCCDEKMKTIVILDCPIDTFECDLDYNHSYLGWSVMTHFSGFLVPDDPDLGLNPAGSVLGLYDVRYTNDAIPGQNWEPDVVRLPFGIASEMGQVFGVAVDEDGCIYAAATSIYLEPDVLYAHGTAGSGGIYKICPDGSGGWNRQDFDALSVQNLNTAAGLGNICYDPVHKQLFVTNFEDGTIYRMDRNTGAILSSWTFPEPMTFETVDTTFEFVDLGRRIWGIGYHIKENRLYFSVWNEDRLRNDSITNNEIWSIGLDATGEFDFIDGHELEITLNDLPGKDYSNPVADISFSANGAMLLGERTMNGDIGFPGDSDFGHEARVLEYRGTHQTNWSLNTNFYVGNFDGVMPTHRNSSGGVDYGYDDIYDEFDDGCDSLVWSTGDALRYPGDNPDNSQEYVYGMAAMPRDGNTNVVGPDFVAVTSLYVDEDGDLDTPAEASIGDMEIFRNPCCNPIPLPCELEVFINENVPSQTFCLGEEVSLNTHITGAIGNYQCLWFSTYPLPGPPDCDFTFVADEIGEFLFVSTVVDNNGCIAQDSIEIIVVDCIECCQDYELFCDKVDESFTYAYTCDSLYVRANGLDHCHTVEWNWGSNNTSGELEGDQMAVYPISGLTSTNLSVRVKEYAGSDFCWDKVMGRSIAATCQDVESMLDDFPFDIDESNLPSITITPNPNLLILDKYDVDVNADGIFEYEDLGSVTVLNHTLTEEVNNVVIRLKRPNCDELCAVEFGHVIVVTDIPTYPEAAISVFPNPTNHLVRVVFQQPLMDDAQLELYDLHGRRLQHQKVPVSSVMTKLNLEELPAAVYMLKIRVREQVFLRKVVKQ